MKSIALIAFTFFTLTAFQNCKEQSSDPSTSSQFQSNSSSTSNQTSSDGNGQPYDGKIFVQNSKCLDGTAVQSRLIFDPEKSYAVLQRENCQSGAARQISSSDIKINLQNSKSIFYNNSEFKMEKPAIPLPGIVLWNYQLTGAIQSLVRPSIQIIDLFDQTTTDILNLKSNGHTVICTISAGTVENWNPDAAQFPATAVGNLVKGQRSENWIHIQNQQVRDIMLQRLNLARDKGCHGVDFDNIDSFTNSSGFNITKDMQLEYNQFLAFAAHDRNLILSFNNVPELATEQAQIFDFAIAEECFKYNECDAYQPFIARNKPVLVAEYGQVSSSQCRSARDQRLSLAYFDSKLDGSRLETCQ